MTITVLNSDAAMRRILSLPPAERDAAAREMLDPMKGMYRYFPGAVDVVELHHLGSGFRIDADDERLTAALEKMQQADVWTRVGRAVEHGISVQLEATPDIRVPDLTVLIVLGNPDDDHFMEVNLGMSANGSTTGYLWINVWPSDENLERIEATAVHELNHNLRYANRLWDPMTVTIGEQVVSEGLADAFARELYGDLGYTRIGLGAADQDGVYEKVVAALGITGMQNFTAYVHGDATAIRFGATPVGLPTGAGYAVGNRIVSAYLAVTGKSAAEALLDDREEIIARGVGSQRRDAV